MVYRTNPHVDQRERAAEAADLLRAMLGGMRTETAFIRLPLTPPTVTLLTAEGPYADLIRLGQTMTGAAGAERVGGRRLRVQRPAEMRHDDHRDGPCR